MRDFDIWLSQLRPSIATFDYYINFEKVIANAKKMKAELNLMNVLVGSSDIEDEFRDLVKRFPSVIRCIPTLLAVREMEIFAREAGGAEGVWYDFDNGSNDINEYCLFMRKSGLFNILSHHLVNNVYDYVVGVETGLDSNGRKNRGGDLMEDLVELYLRRAGVQYFKEMKAADVQERFHVDLSPLTNRGKTVKRFDFVVRTPECVYGIETNFYSSDREGHGGGSKLNETARSYKMLAIEAAGIPGFKLVWFTDGCAWNSARNNLKETFDVLPTLYNIKELEDGIATTLFV